MIFNNIDQLKQVLEKEGRIIGLDIGTKTIGVAISDGSQMIATPKTTISRKGNKIDFPIIKKLIEDNDIKALILGLPLNMDETQSQMSEFVKRFADNLDKFLNSEIKISFFDERLSSSEAKDILGNIANLDQELWSASDQMTKRPKRYTRNAKKKGLIDQIAAGVILQSALDNLS